MAGKDNRTPLLGSRSLKGTVPVDFAEQERDDSLSRSTYIMCLINQL